MNTTERVELALIPLCGVGIWSADTALPDRIGVGRLLLWASVLLLLQSLLRDLWLLTKARGKPPANPPKAAQCMCVESMVGMTGIIVGLLLFSFGFGKLVSMERWTWSVFVILVLGTGFAIKDYVLEANPWRLRRDKDHVNIIVRWKK